MNKILIGFPASKGTAKGTAKIILSSSQFSKFNPGDILIAKQTSPAWTPLLGTAKAVVTEFGGALSHAAIVAREYGIPAVVGVKNATKQIENNQTIIVKGEKGEIECL
jgi:pyruvate,water dikinase